MKDACLSIVLLLLLISCTPKTGQETTTQLPESIETDTIKPVIADADSLLRMRRLPDGVEEPKHQRIKADGKTFGERRVEPPFWWVGMKNPTVELVIYERLIKGYKVNVNYPGVKVLNVTPVENPNYLFVELEIDLDTKPGKFRILLTKGDVVRPVDYELKARTVTPSKGLDPSDYIYLIMPDRFANGDPSNDIVPTMQQKGIYRDRIFFRHGGDIQGVIDKLDYLQEMGITTLWLNPVQENDEPYESYHGYAVTESYKIDARFGTNELYKQLVDECHRRGMKVVMDIIHNHFGDQHWLIKDLPEEDFIHQFDTFTRSNYREIVHMDPYVAQVDLERMTQGWFDHHMPDLNQKNPRMARYLIQQNIWWTEYTGHDGYRIDTYTYPNQDFMSDWAAAQLAEYPDLTLFGETWVHGTATQAYFTKDQHLGERGNTNLPAVTDFQMNFAIMDALLKPQGWTDGVAKLYYTLGKDFVYDDPYNNVLFLDNHDMNRLFSTLNGDIRKWKSGMILLSTLRGIPCLYYGTEILMQGQGGAFGEAGRIDFPGGWLDDPVNKFTTQGKTQQENEAYNFLKNLLNYRKNNSALHRGQLMQYVPENGIYVYFRYDENQRIMVVYNSNADDKSITTARFSEGMKAARKGINVMTGQRIDDLSTLNIEAHSTLLIELR